MGEQGNQLWDLLNQCWDHDTKMRPTASQVQQRVGLDQFALGVV